MSIVRARGEYLGNVSCHFCISGLQIILVSISDDACLLLSPLSPLPLPIPLSPLSPLLSVRSLETRFNFANSLSSLGPVQATGVAFHELINFFGPRRGVGRRLELLFIESLTFLCLVGAQTGDPSVFS